MIDSCKRNIENCTEAELDEEEVTEAGKGQAVPDSIEAEDHTQQSKPDALQSVCVYSLSSASVYLSSLKA